MSEEGSLSEEQSQVSSIPWRIDAWFNDLSPTEKVLLKKYFDELIRVNKAINLISAKTIALADLLHFADSILASRVVAAQLPSGATIFDIGSGNGLPGIIFSILYPKFSVVLVESDQKKTEFLKQIISFLDLKNVSLKSLSVESLPDSSIEFGMSRGFASISKSILLTRKLFKNDGVFFHLKGDQWGLEVAEIPTQLCSVWSPALVADYKLPTTNIKLSVVKTTKITK